MIFSAVIIVLGNEEWDAWTGSRQPSNALWGNPEGAETREVT